MTEELCDDAAYEAAKQELGPLIDHFKARGVDVVGALGASVFMAAQCVATLIEHEGGTARDKRRLAEKAGKTLITMSRHE